MKAVSTLFRVIAALLALVTVLAMLAACDNENETTAAGANGDGNGQTHVDYAAQVKLDMESTETVKKKVTVKNYVDGDTTHFNFPGFGTQDTLKARYLAINTPESTGKIEEWGKKASNFTKEKLSTAASIVIESDTAKWDADSTGDRFLVWVWYQPAENESYRNLNIEILQEGLAIASNSGNNRYGDICMKALGQARQEKLNCHSGKRDPDFFYGEAIAVTLKELRCNTEAYVSQKVAFEGVVTKLDNNAVYVENYDEETELYYGMYIYYGFNLSTKGKTILTTVGNRVRIVGSVQFYEGSGSYQISDVSYNMMKPNHANNLKLLEEDQPASYQVTTADQLYTDVKLEFATAEDEVEEKTFKYGELALGTTRIFENLTVTSVYTTANGGESDGAMSITCKDEKGNTFTVRTIVLHDEDGNKITASAFRGKTMDVKGVLDIYEGNYQLKLFSMSDVTFH